MPSSATGPTFTAVGEIDIAGAAGELDGFAAPVCPIHPEIERVAQNARRSVAWSHRVGFFECWRAAGSGEQPQILRGELFPIADIVAGGQESTPLYASTAVGQAFPLS
jgi:hypothetical protein